MENVLKADPSFVNFTPRTAVEAVDRFTRCQRNGLKAVMVPECLIRCARGLRGPELDLFEDWVINPNRQRFDNIVPADSIRAANEELYRETLRLRDGPSEVPPVPCVPPNSDDEKMQEPSDFARLSLDEEDEKMM